MEEYRLNERCLISSNKETDKFVGVECAHGDFHVHFPIGFRLSNNDTDIRKDLRLLINSISSTTGSKVSQTPYYSHFMENTGIPINSFIYVINDYYERGLYRERDIKYDVSYDGDIDWNRTISTQTAYIQNTEPFYLDFVTKKSIIKDAELITRIQQYCLYLGFKAVGWLFTNYVPLEPSKNINEKLFINTLKNKMLHTYNDKNRMLFWHMIAIMENRYDDNALYNYRYGTNRFEYIWEALIDRAFGIGERKKDFFPATFWQLYNDINPKMNHKLEPDSIMFFEGDVYVLDAKYYKYGSRKPGEQAKSGDLPESTSINKQITYGEFIAKEKRFKKQLKGNYRVYNAFLMPYDKVKWNEQDDYKWIGRSWGDWKGEKKYSYSQIQGILIDTKRLMEIGNLYSSTEVSKLANLIKKHVILNNNQKSD